MIIIIIIIFILFSISSHFWGPKHMWKLTKICTHVGSGENRRLVWVLGMSVVKWLDSAP